FPSISYKGQAGALDTDGESIFINFTDPDGPSVIFGDDRVGFLAAETEHARQFEDGELGFEETGSPNGLIWMADDTYDMIDERKSYLFGQRVSDGDKTYLRRKHRTIKRSFKTFNGKMGIYTTPVSNWVNAGKPIDGVNHKPDASGKAKTVRNIGEFYRTPAIN
ncbi:MAG: hypothetical protein AAF135_11370, partial [Bacteroidota bacterium]